jgi:hypothetical protein
VKEMERMKINIIRIGESRWTNNGACQYRGTSFYYSGRTDNEHRNGIGIIIKNIIKRHIKNVVAYSDRIIMIQLEGKPTNINIIQIHAPTADKPDEEITKFYKQLREVLGHTKST